MATEGEGRATPSASEQQRRAGVGRAGALRHAEAAEPGRGRGAPGLPTAVRSATPQPAAPGLAGHLLCPAPGTPGVAGAGKAWLLAPRHSRPRCSGVGAVPRRRGKRTAGAGTRRYRTRGAGGGGMMCRGVQGQARGRPWGGGGDGPGGQPVRAGEPTRATACARS